VIWELAKSDSAIGKTFSPCWKWSHLIAAQCGREQQEKFLKPFVADDTFLLGFASAEPNGGFYLRAGSARPFGDFELAANALGICDAAVEMAMQHARTRWADAKYFIDQRMKAVRKH
jgi:alkylation response protein AidB-like acyl-CoA dehydrogenase